LRISGKTVEVKRAPLHSVHYKSCMHWPGIEPGLWRRVFYQQFRMVISF